MPESLLAWLLGPTAHFCNGFASTLSQWCRITKAAWAALAIVQLTHTSVYARMNTHNLKDPTCPLAPSTQGIGSAAAAEL